VSAKAKHAVNIMVYLPCISEYEVVQSINNNLRSHDTVGLQLQMDLNTKKCNEFVRKERKQNSPF
jgi:hypothetical protein